jgi:hypothetical protein
VLVGKVYSYPENKINNIIKAVVKIMCTLTLKHAVIIIATSDKEEVSPPITVLNHTCSNSAFIDLLACRVLILPTYSQSKKEEEKEEEEKEEEVV